MCAFAQGDGLMTEQEAIAEINRMMDKIIEDHRKMIAAKKVK